MSERNYELLDGKELILDGDGLWMWHPELGKQPTSTDLVFGDLLALVNSLQQQVVQKDREMSHVSERLKFIDDGMDKAVAGFDRVVAQRDALREQMAARDQTIAQLQEMDKLHTSGAKQLVQDLHTLREERDKFRKALSDVHNAARWGDLDRIEGIIDTALSE